MDLLMMKHMDGVIGDEEAERLRSHIGTCAKCEDDFMIYEEIMNGLPGRTVFAPDNFENLVMEKIYALPENKKHFIKLDGLLCVVWGLLTALAGLALFTAANRDAALDFVAARPSLTGLTDAIIVVSRIVENAAAFLRGSASAVASSVSGYVESSRFMLMLIIAVLAMVQYVVHKKNKAEV